MKRLVWPGGAAFLLAAALVTIPGLLTPTRLAAKPGSRLCGAMTSLTAPATLPATPNYPAGSRKIALVAIVHEARQDRVDYNKRCDEAKQGAQAGLIQNFGSLIAPGDMVFVDKQPCEVVGDFYKGKKVLGTPPPSWPSADQIASYTVNAAAPTVNVDVCQHMEALHTFLLQSWNVAPEILQGLQSDAYPTAREKADALRKLDLPQPYVVHVLKVQ